MTKAPPTVTGICPSCQHRAEAPCLRDTTGVLHAGRLSSAMLVRHKHCDLNDLIAELNRAAYRLSRVQVFNVKGDDEDG